MSRIVRSLVVMLASVALVAAPGFSPAAHAQAWASAATAAVHPGVQMVTNGAGCTANFIYSDGANVFIGQAAHCASTAISTQTDGCTTASLPINTPVAVQGATRPGVLAYSSWITMQQVGETDPNTCAFNDLALVRLDPADVSLVNPSVPVWGGPLALSGNATGGGTTPGERLFSYGNSRMRPDTLLSPREGVSVGDRGAGWAHDGYYVSPAIPGDSGSAVLDAAGNAVGIISFLEIVVLDANVPTAQVGSITATDLSQELAYLHAHGPTSVSRADLVPGTEAFNPGAVPVG